MVKILICKGFYAQFGGYLDDYVNPAGATGGFENVSLWWDRIESSLDRSHFIENQAEIAPRQNVFSIKVNNSAVISLKVVKNMWFVARVFSYSTFVSYSRPHHNVKKNFANEISTVFFNVRSAHQALRGITIWPKFNLETDIDYECQILVETSKTFENVIKIRLWTWNTKCSAYSNSNEKP